MAKKKVTGFVKLQIPAGAANPAPPVGPALGAQGVNIMQFCQQFNAATQDKSGTIIPVEITIYEDKSFTFITKTHPGPPSLSKEALGIKSGSAVPQRDKGRPADAGAAPSNRRDQDARPQCQLHRGGHEDHRRHRPLHGRHRR